MKPNYSLFFILVVIAFACKKETIEPATGEPSVTVEAIGNCYGNSWTAAPDYEGCYNSPCLVYNNKAYFFNKLVEPTSNPYNRTVTIFDGVNWETKPSDVPLPYSQFGNDHFWFTIGNKGYIGRSSNPGFGYPKWLYEYDFAANTWTEKAEFEGPGRYESSFFSVGNKGYVVGGQQGGSLPHLNDTWEYNPSNNSWTQKASIPNFGRYSGTGFSIGNKGYIVNGLISVTNGTNPPYDFYLNDLYEYNPANNTWTGKAPFPGEPRRRTKAFVISGNAYVGGGSDGSDQLIDFYKYSPESNTWGEIADFTFTSTNYSKTNGFSINSKGYIVWPGYSTPKIQKYTPRYCVNLPTTSVVNNSGN